MKKSHLNRYELLLKEFSTDLNVKKESEKLNLRNKREKLETVSISDMHHETESESQDYEDEVTDEGSACHRDCIMSLKWNDLLRRSLSGSMLLGKIDIDKLSPPKKQPLPQKEEKALYPMPR